MNKTNTSPRNVSLFCYRSVNSFLCKALLFVATRLTRLAALLLAANRKASWNKARIRYKCCACCWTIWILPTQTFTI